MSHATPAHSDPAEEPKPKKTFLETVLISTPIALTVIATILAGLSSSEMSQAQYFRSLAAQLQSKASDQWSFFQAKKMRANEFRNSAQIIQELSPAAASDLSSAAAALSTALKNDTPSTAPSADFPALAHHFENALAPLASNPSAQTDRQISAVTRAVNDRLPDAELERQAGAIPESSINTAINSALQDAVSFDKSIDPARQAADKLQHALDQLAKSGISPTLLRPFSLSLRLALLNFDADRSDADARYNQALAQLYEIHVHREAYASDRRVIRSKRFFYGMLAAQAGVTVATLALAIKRGMVLWGLAAAAGLAAITFASYVYLFV